MSVLLQIINYWSYMTLDCLIFVTCITWDIIPLNKLIIPRIKNYYFWIIHNAIQGWLVQKLWNAAWLWWFLSVYSRCDLKAWNAFFAVGLSNYGRNHTPGGQVSSHGCIWLVRYRNTHSLSQIKYWITRLHFRHPSSHSSKWCDSPNGIPLACLVAFIATFSPRV